MLRLLNRRCFVTQSCNTCTLFGKKMFEYLYCETNGNWNNFSSTQKQIRYKSYDRFLDYSKIPELQEDDLQEQFVRGSGPGGQAINKTNNAVILKHKPTGLVVKCHETRSLQQNRKIARDILLKKVDNLVNGDDSLENQKERLMRVDSIKKKQKKKKLADLKNAFMKRENLK